MPHPDRTVYHRYGLTLVVLFACLAPFVVWGYLRAAEQIDNNVYYWLPAEDEQTLLYDWFQQHFGVEAFAVVSWEGCHLGDPRLEQLAGLLVGDGQEAGDGQQPLFQRVQTGTRLVETLTAPPLRLERQEAIERLVGTLVGQDRQTTGALVAFSQQGMEQPQRAAARLRHVAVEQVGIDPEQLRLAGEPVLNAEIDRASEDAIGGFFFLSIAIAVLVALVSLRSLRLTAIVLVVAAYSAVLAQALVYYTGAALNLVLVVMPVLVFVLTLSASVHLVNYFRDAAVEGLADAPARAMARGWLPCSLAAGTTTIGVGALTASRIVPVQQFGLYAAAGILASLVLLFLVLPSLLALLVHRLPAGGGSAGSGGRATAPQASPPSDRLSRIARFVIRHHGWLAAGGLAVLLFCSWGVPWIETTVRPSRFFREDARILRDYQWLEQTFGPQVPVELVVVVDDQQSPLNTLERLALVGQIQQQVTTLEQVGGTLSAASFVPPPERLVETRPPTGSLGRMARALGRAAGVRQEQVLPQVINRRLEEHRQELVDNRYLSQDQTEELWRISARLPSGTDLEYDVFLDRIQTRLDAFLQQQPAERVRGVRLEYTGMAPLFYYAQRQLLEGLFRSFLVAFLLIAVVLVVLFRSLRAGLLAILPSVFPAAVVFGALGWLGIQVDIGSMLTASIALGIAVDDTVHFLTWFRRGIGEGMERHQAIEYAYHRCATAMTQTTAIAGLGIGIYAFSPFLPVALFGLLLLVLLTAALLGDLVLLPALMAGPAGTVFLRHRRTT